MKLSQKRTCNRCMAFVRSPYPDCFLHYNFSAPLWIGMPKEKCYKPITKSEFAMAYNLRFNKVHDN